MGLKTCVRICRNRPTLFIAEQPHTGLMHWHSKPAVAAEDVARLGEAGIDLFTCPLGLGGGWPGDARTDFAPIDRVMTTLLEANPRLLVMPRLGLEPPRAWKESHPAELMVSYNIDTGARQLNGRVAVTSKTWRQDAAAVIARLVEHLETAWGDHILGYHPGSGDCGEHSYDWGFPDKVVSDYSAPQVQAFRDWLRVRYGQDVTRLRTAWQMPDADFDAAAVPPLAQRVRARAESSLFDPARHRWVIDYLTFHSEAMAEAVLFACGTVKMALRRLGREKIVAAFYAYHHWGLGEPQLCFNSGHHAHARVLESPDVDVLCAPNYYPNRHSGGSHASQVLPASLRLHGKLYYAEEDTGTHRVTFPGWWGFVCRDAEMSCHILRRNLLGVLQDGATQWWMDWEGAGWYRDKTILGELAALREFAEDCLRRDYASQAQIAVLVSDTSMACLRHDANLKDALLDRQLEELTALGAPFDLYRVGDIEKLVRTPKVADYRLILFLDTLTISPREKALIAEHLARDNRTLLWPYAPGLVREHAWDIDFVSELTGVRLRLQDAVRPSLLVETWLTGQRLVYGIDKPVGPILAGDDTDATVVGFKTDSTTGACPERGDEPGLLIKEMRGWRSVWSAAPGLPSSLVQHIARQAGVHIYSERGDQVFVGADWLGLHARLDGETVVRLPRAATVSDQRTGARIGMGVQQFTIATQRGKTHLWKIQTDSGKDNP